MPRRNRRCDALFDVRYLNQSFPAEKCPFPTIESEQEELEPDRPTPAALITISTMLGHGALLNLVSTIASTNSANLRP